MNSDNIIEQLAIEGWAKKKKRKKNIGSVCDNERR